MDSRILIPIRYGAWLAGTLGRRLQEELETALDHLGDLRVTRLPRALLVEADEETGPLTESVHGAVCRLEQVVADRYPVFHHEMGPVWTGTLQVVFPDTGRTRPSTATASSKASGMARHEAPVPL